MEVSRKALLEVLESVQPGLSPEATIEQSDCFIFQGGRVFTYDDEVACSSESSLDIEGAIKAKPLFDLLHKMPEEVVDIEIGEGEVKIAGQRRRSGVRMEQEIVLSIDGIQFPKEKDWKELRAEFCEGLEVVRQCAANDDADHRLTCIHIHPNHLESCDQNQATRYSLKTRFKQEALVKTKATSHLAHLSVVQFAEAENWIHFRNAKGVTISCRRYEETFPDLDPVLEINGQKVILPDGIVVATELAQIFSRDNADNDSVEIYLRKGKLTIAGEGPQGWYKETKKVDYKGEDIRFRITPSLLKRVLERSSECWLSSDKLWIDAGKFVYVTATIPENNAEEEEED